MLGREPSTGNKNSLSTPFVDHSPQPLLTPAQGAAVEEGRHTRPARVGRRRLSSHAVSRVHSTPL